MKKVSRWKRFQNMKKLNWFLLLGVCVGIFFEFLSFQMFNGIIPGSNPYCGSGKYIWPGFDVNEVYLAACIPRNIYYQQFFWIGWVCILISGGIFALSNFISMISFFYQRKNRVIDTHEMD
ncbi:MAG: hypothetical protein ACTSRX_04550 [Promethearchaeota archaeon]